MNCCLHDYLFLFNFCCHFSFQSSYHSWEPNAQGKQFSLNLRTFREQKLSGHVKSHRNSPLRMWRGSPNMGSNEDRSRFISTGNHLGSLWLIGANNQNDHPYLLDWYYTDATSRDVPTDHHQISETEHPSRDWMPSNSPQNEPEYDEYMNEYRDDERAASPLGASTSAPIFRESLTQDRNSDELRHAAMSHWWARSNPQGGRGQTSFFEPPDFNDQ